MEKTFLEKELEKSMELLGSPLARRIYLDEIELIAQIDDLEVPRRLLDEAKTSKEKILLEACFLSDAQEVTVMYEGLKFMRRSVYDNFLIQYWIETESKKHALEKKVDEIIKNRDYLFEVVQVALKETPTSSSELVKSCEWPGVILFEIMSHEDGDTFVYNKLEAYPKEERVELAPKYNKSISKIHNYFDGMQRSPKDICSAINYFLITNKGKS